MVGNRKRTNQVYSFTRYATQKFVIGLKMAFTGKKYVIWQFALLSVGFFLTFGAYFAILFLQSSINIEGGLGAISGTVIYSCSVVFGIFLTPIIIRMFGAKYAVILCQMGYLLYVLTNFHPVGYLMIPASIVSAFAEATMWPAMILFSVHFGRCHARFGKKEVRQYETEYIGYFFLGYQLSQVFSNLVSYGILYGGASQHQSNISHATSAESNNVNRLLACGINDCQDPNITAANLAQYVPTSPTILYIVIGVMAGLSLVAIGIHSITTKPIDQSLEGKRSIDKPTHTIDDGESQGYEHGEVATSKGCLCGGNKHTLLVSLTTIKSTLRHMIQPKLLLIAPITIYCGMAFSFGFAELTRAFVSCMIGVDQVGLCMAIFSATAALVSLSITKLASSFGVNITVAIGFLFDIGGYMLCLFWEPKDDNLCVVYVLFVVAGIINGIWPPISNEIHASFFPDNQDVAFTAWNALFLLGFAIQYGWSTSVCVNVKIYIQIGILCFSVIGYAIARILNKQRTREI